MAGVFILLHQFQMGMVRMPKDSTNCEASKLCPERNVSKDGTHVALNMAIQLFPRPCFVLKRTMVQPALETVEVKITVALLQPLISLLYCKET